MKSVSTIQSFFFAASLSVIGGCASMSQINACNQLAYQQAPPVYDSRNARMLMQCPIGMSPFGMHPHWQTMPPTPFYCNQLLMNEDLNRGARRAVFDACMSGATPAAVVIE